MVQERLPTLTHPLCLPSGGPQLPGSSGGFPASYWAVPPGGSVPQLGHHSQHGHYAESHVPDNPLPPPPPPPAVAATRYVSPAPPHGGFSWGLTTEETIAIGHLGARVRPWWEMQCGDVASRKPVSLWEAEEQQRGTQRGGWFIVLRCTSPFKTLGTVS